MSCLGGIIESSLVSLFEYKPFRKAWRISRPDFVVMCVTAATTALVNIEVRTPPAPHTCVYVCMRRT